MGERRPGKRWATLVVVVVLWWNGIAGVRRNVGKKVRKRSYLKTKKSVKRELAMKRKGITPGKMGKGETRTYSQFTLPDPVEGLDADKFNEEMGMPRSVTDPDFLQDLKMIPTNMKWDIKQDPIPPSKPLPILQWPVKDLIKIARAAREAQNKFKLPEIEYMKRYPGFVDKAEIWERLPSVVRDLLDSYRIRNFVLYNKTSLVESLTMPRNIFHSELWKPMSAEWETNMERAFEKFAFNITHISFASAQMALGSDLLGTPLPADTLKVLTMNTKTRSFSAISTNEGSAQSIKAVDTSEGTIQLLENISEILLDFREFRILAGIAEGGVFQRIPSSEEIQIADDIAISEEKRRIQFKNDLEYKFLPKCDWPIQRRLDEKRRRARLEPFFLKNGLGKATLRGINDRRDGTAKKLIYMQDAMEILSGFRNVSFGYDRLFGKYFNRAHRKAEPGFRVAILNEFLWFAEKGYVTMRPNATVEIRKSSMDTLMEMLSGKLLEEPAEPRNPVSAKKDIMPGTSTLEKFRNLFHVKEKEGEFGSHLVKMAGRRLGLRKDLLKE